MSVFKYLLFALILVNCSNSDNSIPVDPVPPVETIPSITIRSDKAKYNPGESVVFKIDKLPKSGTCNKTRY